MSSNVNRDFEQSKTERPLISDHFVNQVGVLSVSYSRDQEEIGHMTQATFHMFRDFKIYLINTKRKKRLGQTQYLPNCIHNPS